MLGFNTQCNVDYVFSPTQHYVHGKVIRKPPPPAFKAVCLSYLTN